MQYRQATIKDLEKIWAKDIQANPDDVNYLRWRDEFITNNQNGGYVTFVVVDGDEPVGQLTIILSVNAPAVCSRPLLCDGNTVANINAVRIEPQYEGQGHISKLFKLAEQYAKQSGINTLTIGVAAKESRTLAIYLHLGYHQFIDSCIENENLILYYQKNLIK